MNTFQQPTCEQMAFILGYTDKEAGFLDRARRTWRKGPMKELGAEVKALGSQAGFLDRARRTWRKGPMKELGAEAKALGSQAVSGITNPFLSRIGMGRATAFTEGGQGLTVSGPSAEELKKLRASRRPVGMTSSRANLEAAQRGAAAAIPTSQRTANQRRVLGVDQTLRAVNKASTELGRISDVVSRERQNLPRYKDMAVLAAIVPALLSGGGMLAQLGQMNALDRMAQQGGMLRPGFQIPQFQPSLPAMPQPQPWQQYAMRKQHAPW